MNILFALSLSILFPVQHSADMVDQYLSRLAATMNAEASAKNVEDLLDLYTDDVIYEHPKVGFKLEGKETIRKGMNSFLSSYAGTKKDVVIEIKNAIHTPLVSTVQFTISFLTNSKEGIKTISRDQVLVFEFKEGKIKRVLDYW